MSFNQKMNEYFPKFTMACGIGAALLLIFIFCHLFFRSFGGPFPERTRGPFARYEHYKLGEMPEWENALKMTEQGKTTTEIFLEGMSSEMPPLQFGQPPEKETITTND